MLYYAVRGRRLLAFVLDFSFLTVVSYVGAYLGAFIAAFLIAMQPVDQSILNHAAASGFMFGALFWAVVGWTLNYGVLQGLGGASVGKLITGIKVTNEDGSQVGFLKSIGRTTLYGFCLFSVFGFAMILWTRRAQGLHDWIFKTVVVLRIAPKSNVVYLDFKTPALSYDYAPVEPRKQKTASRK